MKNFVITILFSIASNSFSEIALHTLGEVVRNHATGVANGRAPRMVDDQGRTNHLARNTLRVRSYHGVFSTGGSAVALGTQCVLTAAHVGSQIETPTNFDFHSSDGTLVGTSNTSRRVPHPTADLAILRLAAPIPWGTGLRLGQLADTEFTSAELRDFRRTSSPDRALIMGYGESRLRRTERTRSGLEIQHGFANSGQLKENTMRISDYFTAPVGGFRTRALLLTSEANVRAEPTEISSVLPGDSGGAVFINGRLHGIITSSVDVAAMWPFFRSSVTTTAASVPHYFPWIREQYEQLGCD